VIFIEFLLTQESPPIFSIQQTLFILTMDSNQQNKLLKVRPIFTPLFLKNRLVQHSVLIFMSLTPVAMADVLVSDWNTLWTPMLGDFDYIADQQTGAASGDIVGVGTNHGMSVTFNDLGNTSTTDGNLGFRLRLDAAGGPTNKPAFDRAAWIGIDADINGSIDAFLGVNLSGSNTDIGIYAPGIGANNSPNTTSIDSTAYRSYVLSSTNYNYRLVNYLFDGGDTNDVTTTTTGDPDYYVSFMVPFADVVSYLATKSISITDQSSLRYVSATATQANSLNQDLGGVNGGVNSNVLWSDLGGFTDTVNASGTVVPEPSTWILVLGSLCGGCWLRRRQRMAR
jgi:hypothetical protein